MRVSVGPSCVELFFLSNRQTSYHRSTVIAFKASNVKKKKRIYYPQISQAFETDAAARTIEGGYRRHVAVL